MASWKFCELKVMWVSEENREHQGRVLPEPRQGTYHGPVESEADVLGS